MSEPTLRLEGVRRRFVQGETVIEVLQGVDLRLEPGTLTAMVGPSGAGKSTLLHIIGLLEPATSGEVWIQGKRCGGLGDRERTRLRRERIGFVYQFHHLLPDFTAQENVMMPRLLAGEGRAAAASRAVELLQRMGLEPRLHHRPGKLSGGEQQRVAIARALANRPSLILADEPTGNLDPHTSEHVVEALIEIVRSSGAAALVATHNLDLAARMDAVYRMSEGVLRRV